MAETGDLTLMRLYGTDDVFRVYHRPTRASVDIPATEVWSWRERSVGLTEEEIRTRIFRLAYQTLRRIADRALQETS